MTNEQIYALKENRYKTLSGNDKNIKAPGVLRKLRREMRNLEKDK